MLPKNIVDGRAFVDNSHKQTRGPDENIEIRQNNISAYSCIFVRNLNITGRQHPDKERLPGFLIIVASG